MGDCAGIFGGVSEELMLPLSVGREVVTHARDIEAVSSFNVWQNGERVVYFDPLLRDPMPTVWEPRMREAGIDPKAGVRCRTVYFTCWGRRLPWRRTIRARLSRPSSYPPRRF
ncbi:DUF6461 domain-containing protein [Rhodococcus globerulus]|uniref:DUF6461 domain-containing protein n=1 Tax=Rhodococcus globerulus TaxID=33008 RepID=UPI001C6FCA74